MSSFDDFIANPDAEKLLLIEVNAFVDGLGEQSFYLSTAPFTTGPTDSIDGVACANRYYDNRLVGQPHFNRSIPEAFYGQTVAGFGDLTVDNSDGSLDDWIGYGWDGRAVTLRLGNAGWNIDDFVVILRGSLERLVIESDTQLRFELRDRSRLLDAPIQSNTLPSTSPAEGEPIPLCYGTVYNCKAALVDPALLLYQVHDGPIQAIDAVYDNGVLLVAGSGYTANLSAGQFTLLANPAGTITADVRGATSGGSWLSKAGQIISHLATRSGGPGLTSADLNSGSLAALDVARPYSLGLFIDSRSNTLSLFDQIAQSIGGWYGFGRGGTLSAGVFDPPAASAVAVLDGNDLIGDLELSQLEQPVYGVDIGYQRNWTVQSGDGLAASVTASRRGWLETEYRTKSARDSSVRTKHLLARVPPRYDTLLADAGEANSEASRRLALAKVQRFRLRLKTFIKPFSLTIGDTVQIVDRRFGLAAGVNAVIVGLDEYFVDNQIELELFK